MKSLVFVVLVATLLSFSGQAPAAAEEQNLKTSDLQHRLSGGIHLLDLERTIALVENLSEKVWLLAQAFSLPITLCCVALGAFLVVLGSIAGRRLVALGLTVFLTSLLGFALINYAPEITGLTKAAAAHFLGGAR